MWITLGFSACAGLTYLTIYSDFYQGYYSNYSIKPYLMGGAFYIFPGIIYAMKFPENTYPKRFDYIGASH